jgi:hypothetical protein
VSLLLQGLAPRRFAALRQAAARLRSSRSRTVDILWFLVIALAAGLAAWKVIG